MPSPKEFAESIRGERSKRRRRILLIGGIGGGVVLLVALLAWMLLLSNVFESREVAVSGNKLLTKDQIVEQAGVPLQVPLLRIDTGIVESNVEQLPEVKDTAVRRDFPNTVSIDITERVPVYQLKQGDSYAWVDGDGVAFRKGQPRHAALPEAKIVKADDRMLGDVATIVQHLPTSMLEQVKLVDAKTVDRVEISLDDNRRVVWGSADESELKAQVIDALLDVEAKLYDVSAPNHPTTR